MKTHIKMTDSQLEIFKSLKQTLESEREIKASDLDSIALLSLMITNLHAAQASLESDGLLIYSQTQYGDVAKSNPACAEVRNCQVAIRGLMSDLLMNPKAKAAINKADVEKHEEDDPLTLALMERSNKRGR
ncbi:TPA: P27 family phage terminase small subunit [Vibrio cholerae]|nr:P27 family phage terminase small subunit [Vibrio cholerae]